MLEAVQTAEHTQNVGSFPPFDTTHYVSQVFWLFLTFCILYFILSKILLPRLSSTIEERRDRIADDLDSVSRMQREAEDAKLAYEKSLSLAREKAHKHAETVKQKVQDEIQKNIMEAETELNEKQQAAEIRIHKVNQAALKNVNTIATDLALSLSERIIEKPVFSQNAVEEIVIHLSKVSPVSKVSSETISDRDPERKG